MPIVNIPIKILGQPHSHSRSNSSSSVDQNPQGSQQQHQQQQPAPNMQRDNFPAFSRSPIPSDFGDFGSSSFQNDGDWAKFPNFPRGFGDFPSFGRLSPFPRDDMNGSRQSFRRSPTPNMESPFSTLRRNSASNPQQQNQHHQQQPQPQQNPQPAQGHQSRKPSPSHNNNAPQSRPSSKASRERKEVEVPERPAVIPLPYPAESKKPEKNADDESNIEENIAKITLGESNNAREADDIPSPLTSPLEGKPKRGKKLQRNQSVVDFNAKTIASLDKIEVDVEAIRKKAAELELEKDQILKTLREISMHSQMLRLAECDREEIEAITERLTKRTETVKVAVETPRNEEQKCALERVNKMMDSLITMMKENVEKAKLCLQTYLNACSSEETTGSVCQNFLKNIIQCAADDQKQIKRRLEGLVKQIEDAEKTTAELIEDESE
ncbi:unnamed protein product [Caenorhabditis bovis]|uniref:BAG domain-containing protein n=1 Tax=Caenorhabditis bovis TaxID=2654633 RepID=A0A8S1E9G5_9PELO|nr:unnamed protein product [Caenorhabditis bovis]